MNKRESLGIYLILFSIIAVGKALYTYADKQKGVVYIGGDNAYQRYKQLAAQQSIAQNELEASYSKMLAKEDRVWSVNYD